jgi:type I restriction-modification system DNA methylase subunit
VNAVDKDRLKDALGKGRRYPFGLPRTDNANYLWIQLFDSTLNEKGRAGFVMANSASDARASEQELRKQLIEARAVDVMVAVGPNVFYTVTLPCTLWFLDKGKTRTSRAAKVLFIDARHIFRQIDRAQTGRVIQRSPSPRVEYRGRRKRYSSPRALLCLLDLPSKWVTLMCAALKLTRIFSAAR